MNYGELLEGCSLVHIPESEENRFYELRMLLNTRESFVLVIDVQEKLAPAMLGIDQVEKNIAALLTAADRLAVPVVVTEHCAEKIGHTILLLRNLVKDEAIMQKKRFSAQSESPIADHLASLKRNKVVVVGTEAHVCVLQTTLDLKKAGYKPHLMVDGTSSRNLLDKDVAINRMHAHGVELVTMEMVLFEWLEQGDTEAFRDLFPLIRNR
jgi:nicotinamidase-related amidase